MIFYLNFHFTYSNKIKQTIKLTHTEYSNYICKKIVIKKDNLFYCTHCNYKK
jgi:hypothetical protein